MESARGRLEEVVFETPDPPPRAALPSSSSKVALPGSPTKASTQEGLDTSALPAQEALSKFAAKEGGTANGRTAAKPRRGYEVAPAGFEPPEQRLARLQAEVADLLRLTEASAEKEAAVAELLGGDPGEMSQELKVLEKRLVALSEGSAPWRGAGGKKARGGYAMPASLISQLDRLASGQASAPASEASGQVTYQINYAPNAASIGEGAKLAAMESTISEIEKQLGVREPISHFPDLQTAVTQLQKRLALLDSPKLEAIAKGVDKVAKEVEQVLAKKAQLEGTTDKDLDHKVSQLYDFCHRWSATAASLPQIVARLQSLQVRVAIRALQGHHSKPAIVQQASIRLYIAQQVPQLQPDMQPWKCTSCNVMNKAAAQFCPSCGKHWSQVHTPSYAGSWNPQAAPWGWGAEDAPDRRPKSPRARGQGRGQDGKGKDAQKGGGKGAGKAREQPPKPPKAEPPQASQLPKPPTTPSVPQPRGPTATGQPTEDRKMLQALVAGLAGADQLPEAVRELMAKVSGNSVQQEAKELHKMVQTRSAAFSALNQIEADRAIYEQSWAAYTTSLVGLLQEQLQTRQHTLQEFDTAQVEWTEKLKEVSAQIKQATKTGGLSSGAEVEQVDSSDEEAMEAEVNDDAERAAKRQVRQEEMQTQHRQILDALQQVQAAAQANAERRDGSLGLERDQSRGQAGASQRRHSQRRSWWWTNAAFWLSSLACRPDSGELFAPPVWRRALHTVFAEPDFCDDVHAGLAACVWRFELDTGDSHDTPVDKRLSEDGDSPCDCDPVPGAGECKVGEWCDVSTFRCSLPHMAPEADEPDEVGVSMHASFREPSSRHLRPDNLSASSVGCTIVSVQAWSEKDVQCNTRAGRRTVSFDPMPLIVPFRASDRLSSVPPLHSVSVAAGILRSPPSSTSHTPPRPRLQAVPFLASQQEVSHSAELAHHATSSAHRFKVGSLSSLGDGTAAVPPPGLPLPQPVHALCSMALDLRGRVPVPACTLHSAGVVSSLPVLDFKGPSPAEAELPTAGADLQFGGTVYGGNSADEFPVPASDSASMPVPITAAALSEQRTTAQTQSSQPPHFAKCVPPVACTTPSVVQSEGATQPLHPTLPAECVPPVACTTPSAEEALPITTQTKPAHNPPSAECVPPVACTTPPTAPSEDMLPTRDSVLPSPGPVPHAPQSGDVQEPASDSTGMPVPITLPAGPFVRPSHGRAPPKAFNEVQLIIAAQAEVYPTWLSGPLLNTPFGTLTRLAGPLSGASADAFFTIFEKNTEALVKRWLPGWSALDLIACALGHVPYRVRAVAFLEKPIPGYPARQMPRAFRAIPIDLRPLSGLVHTIAVGCPSLTRDAWQALRDKGATLCRAGEPLEDAAAPELLDESQAPAPRIAAHDFYPTWLTVPSAALGEACVDLHITYPGDGAPC
eukprot:s1089_g13.t1